MKKFLFLYAHSGDYRSLPEAEMAETVKVWKAWLGGLGSTLVDAGNPFGSDAKNIASSGKVSDGPVGVLATGYSIVAAESLDQAVKVGQSCPVLNDGGDITVYEIFDVM